MSKELTPLEAFYKLGDNTPITENWRIVETALVKLEKAENCVFTSKEDVKKEHQALEIIKEIIPIEENAFEYDIGSDTYYFLDIPVAKDKYDLLKEVLL